MDNIDGLAAEVDKLKSVFQKFDEKNNDFAATLSDDNDLDECEDYFSEVQNNFIKVLEQVKRILHVCSPVIQTPAQSPTDSNLAKLLGAVNYLRLRFECFQVTLLSFINSWRALSSMLITTVPMIVSS